MRRLLLIGVVAILGGGGFWATWELLHSPRWSLYQIGKAIHQRDARLFLAYVDLERIVREQKGEFVREFLPEKGHDETRQVLGAILEAFLDPLTALVKDRVVKVVADPERENLPSSFTLALAATVDTRGEEAVVTFADADRRLRLGLRRQPEGDVWRVVRVEPQDLRRLVEDYLKDRMPRKQSSLRLRPVAVPAG